MTAALHTVLAASEPSKVPFYVMGGILAGWAVVLSAIGLSQADFPGSAARARAVMGISAVLVLGTVTAAVATSTKRKSESPTEAAEPRGGGQEPAPPGTDTTQEQPSQAAGTPGGGGGGGGGLTLQVTADPSGQLKYQQATLTSKPGKVRIDFDNPSPIDHDVTITEGDTKLGGTKVIASGKTSATVDLKPGSYTFYCSVDAHRQAGMEGKLTVS